MREIKKLPGMAPSTEKGRRVSSQKLHEKFMVLDLKKLKKESQPENLSKVSIDAQGECVWLSLVAHASSSDLMIVT